MKAKTRKNLFLFGILSVLLLITAACGTAPQPAAPAPAPAAAPATASAPAPAPAPAPKTDYPKSPIRFIITHAAGGSTDNIVRIIQPYLQEALGGNPIVIENMVGAGGNIARNFVYKAKPDGYAVLVSQFPSMMIGEVAQGGQFKTQEMTPIRQLVGGQAQALIVATDNKAKTFKELIEQSKAKKLNVAGPGLGTNGHLAFALFRKAGLKSEYIPFDSGPQAALAVAGKQVDAGSADTVSLPTLVKEGKIRVLTHAGLGPDENAPGVPTLIEAANMPGAGFEISIGVMGPPGVPADITKILGDAIGKALNNADFKDKAKKAGYEVSSSMTPEQFKKNVTDGYKLVEGFKSDLETPAAKK